MPKHVVSLNKNKKPIQFNLINQLDAAINYRCIACRLDTAQHVSGILMPIIRNSTTAAETVGTWW
jgi:hypothetical protein